MRVIDQDTGKQINLDRTSEFEIDIDAFTAERCEHMALEVRRRKITGGSYHFFRQCSGCGASVGNALRKSPELKNAPIWDYQLESFYLQNRENKRLTIIQKHVRLQRDRTEGFWKQYNEYLRSDSWLKKRAKVLQRARGICEGCLNKDATQVHHLTYEHVFEEFLFELVAVCDECHQRTHADQEQAEEAVNEWQEGFPCWGCRWQSEENNRRWCGKFDVLALQALAPDGQCGPRHAELEPLK